MKTSTFKVTLYYLLTFVPAFFIILQLGDLDVKLKQAISNLPYGVFILLVFLILRLSLAFMMIENKKWRIRSIAHLPPSNLQELFVDIAYFSILGFLFWSVPRSIVDLLAVWLLGSK